MAKDDEKTEEPKKSGKGKLIMIIVPVILLLAGGAYFFLLKPSDAAATTELPEPVPGAVVQLDPITVNLDGGHFLKLGLALQPTSTAGEEVNGAKALDLAIGQFSNLTVDDLSSNKGRTEAKDELVARVKLAYLPEGTSIAAATGHESSAKDESSSKSERSSEGKGEGSSEDDGGGDSAGASEQTPAGMSGAQAVKLARELTVQPLVYDVYLTEFVMQ